MERRKEGRKEGKEPYFTGLYPWGASHTAHSVKQVQIHARTAAPTSYTHLHTRAALQGHRQLLITRVTCGVRAPWCVILEGKK